MCVSACVCEGIAYYLRREGKERQRERGRGSEDCMGMFVSVCWRGKRERDTIVCVCEFVCASECVCM